MVHSQNIPPRDGLDNFIVDGRIGSSSQQPALPSRRDLRAKTKTQSKSKSKSKGDARPPAPPIARPTDSAYPLGRVIVVRRAPKQLGKKRGSGFLTILAVIGLFGSVALPAYAMVPKADADSLVSGTTADAGVSIKVADDVELATTARGSFKATTAFDLRNQKRTADMAANYEVYMASGARELGDDYPWFSELANTQGGGLSPLNYFYRECVDFVAWRLNRDAGTLTAPYAFTWSNLTPTGGNASQWKYAWTSKGWPTSSTPIAGAVAWYNYNHVAYVKSVNADGTITVEDYNQQGMHKYGIRTVPANNAQLYLYPPPR